MASSFEQGPIRPPSEAKSLLIRATRNCPWNKCAFCRTYQRKKFELRTVEEIKEDIRQAKAIADDIKALSWKCGGGGEVTDSLARLIFNEGSGYNDSYRSVCAWLYWGGTSVFLQDANSLILKTDDLVEIISFLKLQFPNVERITSYCRSKTAARKSVEELKKLLAAGLSRIHVGLESGYDPLLKFIDKGVTAADHIEGGRRIVEAGISLCTYVIPGLGADRWSREHAVATAEVINAINPDYIRLRSLQVVKGTGLHELMQKGEFTPANEEHTLQEIRTFIEHLVGIQSTLVSDHILNLLEELEGKLPEEKERLLSVIDRYFAMSHEDRMIFRLGRRQGLYRQLSDLNDGHTYQRLKAVVSEYVAEGSEKFNKDLKRLMDNYI
jgi:radical SAM superfamily enzyme YgiQ (UPF0313 family)